MIEIRIQIKEGEDEYVEIRSASTGVPDGTESEREAATLFRDAIAAVEEELMKKYKNGGSWQGPKTQGEQFFE